MTEQGPSKKHNLRTRDVALLLEVTEETVRRRVRHRGLPAIMPGFELEFCEEDVLAWKVAQKPRPRRKRALDQP